MDAKRYSNLADELSEALADLDGVSGIYDYLSDEEFDELADAVDMLFDIAHFIESNPE